MLFEYSNENKLNRLFILFSSFFSYYYYTLETIKIKKLHWKTDEYAYFIAILNTFAFYFLCIQSSREIEIWINVSLSKKNSICSIKEEIC